jgi:hypothetical protein
MSAVGVSYPLSERCPGPVEAAAAGHRLDAEDLGRFLGGHPSPAHQDDRGPLGGRQQGQGGQGVQASLHRVRVAGGWQ